MWESILATIGYDILKKFLADLGQVLASLYSKFKQNQTNTENSNKLGADIANGASNEQVAHDGENLLNGNKP